MPRVILLPLVVLALAVGGCGSNEPPPNQATSPGVPTRPQQSAPPSPGLLPSPTSSTPKAPKPSTPRAANDKTGLALPRLTRPTRQVIGAHLLSESRMPSLEHGFVWAVESDGAENAESVGACQKTSLKSIGALSAIRRSYVAGDESADAIQVVARFADKVSAWRANEVLEAWRKDCEERLTYPRKAVGPMQGVPVDAGIGATYAAAYGPKSTARGHVAGFGIVRKGSYLSIVEISAGPDTFPLGWDPLRAAVRRIARTFA